MRTENIIISAALLFFLLSVISTAQAQEKVIFPSAPIPPSAFKIKQAKAKGITLQPTPGIDITGYMFRPDHKSPRPAIITLVSSEGLQNSHRLWGQKLADWGYVNLLIDSYGSRGGTSLRDTPNANLFNDAYNAYHFLQTQKYVKNDQIALLGFSIGGSSLFSILNAANPRRPEGITFKAGIALYPNCDTSIKLIAPMLILQGDKDPINSSHSCKAVAKEANQWENDITYHLYSGVTHFYDDKNYSKIEGDRSKAQSLPYQFEKNHYDEKAHEHSLILIKSFLGQHLN
ncbi:dienelactone hydrolase family protein [Kiloniella majae]|uniref:dienelactone hydrolase family protein n=1 Tax=Kiloniella majae TaxID=1938558 RepID=UPI000A278373|nr:dienelactone hydrolase family protein [Kiloniella majae]